VSPTVAFTWARIEGRREGGREGGKNSEFGMQEGGREGRKRKLYLCKAVEKHGKLRMVRVALPSLYQYIYIYHPPPSKSKKKVNKWRSELPSLPPSLTSADLRRKEMG